LIRPDDVLSSVRVEPVETLRQAQGERFKLHRAGAIVTVVKPTNNKQPKLHCWVVAIAYRMRYVYVKFIGTHAEYDKVDAAVVDQFKGI
jgi:hypothetical protein